MIVLICASVFAVVTALPAPQILAPGPALTAIPATNHILILTPQAQVQLEPSLKYSPPIVQHLAPVARIDSPTDQTVVYYPNENFVNNAYQKSEIRPKQLESANLTNIVNQFVSAGQTAQAQLEAFQQQLTQGLETLIQPSGGQKLEGEKEQLESKLIETRRQESGRLYSVPGAPQLYSNFELIQTAVNPIFGVHPYTAIRARSVPIPEEQLPEKAALIEFPKTDDTKLEKESANIQTDVPKNTEEKIIETVKSPEQNSLSEIAKTQNTEIVSDNLRFGKCMGSSENKENNGKPLENSTELKKQADLGTFAEALPYGVAISGEGGLSQAKPIGSAIAGKDGVAFSAPSATAIAGSSNVKDN